MYNYVVSKQFNKHVDREIRVGGLQNTHFIGDIRIFINIWYNYVINK